MSASRPPGAPRPVTPVAVGVLVRADGAVLLADRPAGKPYAGYWEFPGGKIEAGETVAQALARELREELGVRIRASDPWVTIEHVYPHAHVRLHFRRVFAWSGAPRAAEAQHLTYLVPGATPPAPLLPAAMPAMRWIELPTVLGCSPGQCREPAQAEQWLAAVLARGLRHIVWRSPALAAPANAASLQRCRDLASAYGARLFIDSDAGARLLAGPPAPDLFLGSMALRAARARPAAGWLGAGVQDTADLERAAALGCDFALIEPAARAAAPWRRIGALCAQAPLPVYAPLAAGAAALQRARRLGAHGLALHVAA